ncbi:MAG: hypothetical protein QOH18_615 [Solirubrobacterales bacterium]|jgi:hypothetical protein|nr:hypothetical protein [Solirubrobacterales bacterium]
MQAEQVGAFEPFGPTWKQALADRSGAGFRDIAAPNVRLEGSIFAKPIEGRDNVWTSFRAAAGITENLAFIHEAAAGDRRYLEWEQEALGRRIEGVSVLVFDDAGLIESVAIHHRPLDAVLAFSAEMGRSLGDSVGRGVFYRPEDG